jgi:hypothetical protein
MKQDPKEIAAKQPYEVGYVMEVLRKYEKEKVVPYKTVKLVRQIIKHTKSREIVNQVLRLLGFEKIPKTTLTLGQKEKAFEIYSQLS